MWPGEVTPAQKGGATEEGAPQGLPSRTRSPVHAVALKANVSSGGDNGQ